MLYWAALALATWASPAALPPRHRGFRLCAHGPSPGRCAGRVTVVPHGVVEGFEPRAGSARIFSWRSPICITQKNLHTLIDAFAALKAARPALTSHRRTAHRRGLRTHRSNGMERLEPRLMPCDSSGVVAPECPAALYRRCAVFVFPSTVETFGNPLVEAMACGAAVACAHAAAMPEVLDDAGVYFDPDDASDMARAIAAIDGRRRLATALRRARRCACKDVFVGRRGPKHGAGLACRGKKGSSCRLTFVVPVHPASWAGLRVLLNTPIDELYLHA